MYCRKGRIQNVHIEAKTLMRRIDTETGLQKVGPVYCWADGAFIPQLFTQWRSDDLDHHQHVKMFFASLFRVFPKNHATSSNRSKVCVRVYPCVYVCVLSRLLVGWVCRFPDFHRFLEKFLATPCGYVCVWVLVKCDVISVSQSLFISDPRTE